MPRTDEQKKQRLKYLKEKCKRITLTFYPTEKDLIDRLRLAYEVEGSYQSYIKSLIYKDIERDRLCEEIDAILDE